MNFGRRLAVEKSVKKLVGEPINKFRLLAPVDDRPKVICVGLT